MLHHRESSDFPQDPTILNIFDRARTLESQGSNGSQGKREDPRSATESRTGPHPAIRADFPAPTEAVGGQAGDAMCGGCLRKRPSKLEQPASDRQRKQ